MSTDSSIKLRLENVDIDLFSSFLGINTPINYDGFRVWNMFSVDLFLSIEKNSPPQLLSNYDKSGKLGIYMMIWCEWYRYYSDVGHITGLTIAKYIFNHFKSDSFFDDEDGLEQTFFYGEKGLILLNTSIFAKKNYPFPDGTLYDFSDLYLKYGTLENKNKTFNSKLDIVVHIPLDSVLSGELNWPDSAKNKSHPWLNTLPPKDEYIVDAFFRGPIKTIIQKGAWQYSGKFVDKPVISMSYKYLCISLPVFS